MSENGNDGGELVPAMSKLSQPRVPEPRRRSVTILDVARRAGVSTATVSRALAVPDQVAEPTRTKVFAAIEETGFTPNATARNLRAQSTKMVLALLPGLGNSFWNVIINAVEEVLTKAGYGVIFGDTRNDPWRENHYDQLVRGGQVDGVLLFTGRLPREGFALLDRTLPITLVCNEVPDLKDLPLFEINNRESARMMVEYLVGCGHRRIAHVTGPATNTEANDRVRGYSDALAAAGIAIADDLVWPGSFTFASGAMAAERYLSLAPAERPTAIFAASDEIAIGCMKALKDGGLAIPRDVSVAGFDGIDYSAMYDPALTTVLQPRAELGRLAAENLVRRMNRDSPPEPPKRTRIPCKLVIRDSVGPAPGAVRGTAERLEAAVSETGARGRRAEASR
jgi:LacI family repressor for deo operon, udp, cdd, tsx, nupC, and nupG